MPEKLEFEQGVRPEEKKTSPEELEVPLEILPEEPEIKTFDPAELLRIKKLPREEKREALREYKEKLIAQREGLAQMQKELTDDIRENPDITKNEFEERLEMYSEELKLAPWQQNVARYTFNSYAKKHAVVEKARKEYPDDAELFKAVFGSSPKGRTEVMKGPMTLYFRCYDPDDYALIHSQAFIARQKPSRADEAAAQTTVGCSIISSLMPELEGAVIAENTSINLTERQREGLYRHEEQHAIKRLFVEVAYTTITLDAINKAENKEDARRLLEDYFRELRKTAEARIKDEILAYMKTGADPVETFFTLTLFQKAGGHYDYLAPLREIGVPALRVNNLNLYEINETARKVLVKEYYKLVNNGIGVFQKLVTQLGYSPEKAVALLIREPLGKWPAAVRRIYEAREKTKR